MGPGTAEIDTHGRTPGRMNFTALVSRFCSTEYISSGSACTTGSQPTSSVAPANSRSGGRVDGELVCHLARGRHRRASGRRRPGRWPCADRASAASGPRPLWCGAAAPRPLGSGCSPSSSSSSSRPATIGAQRNPHVMAQLGRQARELHRCNVRGSGSVPDRGVRALGLCGDRRLATCANHQEHLQCTRSKPPGTGVVRASEIWGGKKRKQNSHGSSDAAIVFQSAV